MAMDMPARQPLYAQLVDLLHDKIEAEMSSGEPLPSERDLCEIYGVSRTTVRLALTELERQGLVVRKRGRGTFVTDVPHEATNLAREYSFTEQMRGLGRVPKTEVLEFQTIEAPKHVARCLEVRLGEKVICMRRLRKADGVPMMLERTYLPATEFIGLTKKDVETRPLYDIIEGQFGEKIRVAEEEFCASIARKGEADLLAVPEGSAVLKLYRTTYNVHNVAIEYTQSVARADQFKYKVSHYRA